MKIPESPLEKNGKKKIDNTLKVMCEEGGIQGRKVNYRAEKTAIRSLILAVVPNHNSAAVLL